MKVVVGFPSLDSGLCVQLGLIAAVLLLGAIYSTPAVAARPAPGAIGINLGALVSWGEQIPFVDVFKMSSPWTLHSDTSFSKQAAPALDANGWVAHLEPGEYAETTIFTGSTGHYPSGQYTLTYQGKGTLTVSGAGVTVIDSAPGRILLQVEAQPVSVRNNGIQIRETNFDPAAPIRNIHLLLPGYAAEPRGNPFNPSFLAVLRPFKVIRFIGWSHASRSDTSTWSDERPITFATQASPAATIQKLSGVSLEYQIQLANLLHADPWFLVPLKADDDFLRRMAELVHERLDPSLHPYVELSNEIWNTYFPESAYVRDMGQKLALDSDPAKAGAKWYVGRALHVFDVWSGVFGSDAARIVRVLAGTFFLPPMTDLELSYQDAYKHVDVFAIGMYILPKFLNDPDTLSRMTTSEVLDGVQSEVTGKMRDFSGYHLGFTKKYGVDLVAYEGGPHLWAQHISPELLPHVLQVLREATESPRMASSYRAMLDQWFASGGSLFNHFNDCSPPGQWGDFGLVEYQSQDVKTSELFQMFSSYIAADRGAVIHAQAASVTSESQRQK